jgi:hypothetical protein
MVQHEKDLYNIVKSVGAHLVQDNLKWSEHYNKASEYKARTYSSDPTVGPYVPVEKYEKLKYYLERVNKNRKMPGSLEDWMVVSSDEDANDEEDCWACDNSDSDADNEDCWDCGSETPDESEGDCWDCGSADEEFYPENFEEFPPEVI